MHGFNGHEIETRLHRSPGRDPAGMTLLEVMIAVAILTVVMGVLFGLATAIGDTAGVQESQTAAYDEARKGMLLMVRDLRQASAFSLSGMPGPTVTYQVAMDLDGNGVAVDIGGDIELSPLRTIERDVDDLNADGITETQLVLSSGDTCMILANDLAEDEDLNQNGTLDTGEDVNGNGVLDRGIWFESSGSAVEVTVQTAGRTRRGHLLTKSLRSTVYPRN